MDPRQGYANQEPPGRASGPSEPSAPPRVHGGYAPAQGREWAGDPRYRDPRRKSPAVAGFLSIVPGVGQVYVGYYQQGFINVIAFASIIAILASGTVPGMEPLLAIFLGFFWLYNIIDAARRAAAYNLALEGTDPGKLPADFESPGLRGSLFGGATLVVFGVIALLHTRFGMSLDWLRDWWPVAPILFGAYLVYKSTAGKAKAA